MAGIIAAQSDHRVIWQIGETERDVLIIPRLGHRDGTAIHGAVVVRWRWWRWWWRWWGRREEVPARMTDADAGIGGDGKAVCRDRSRSLEGHLAGRVVVTDKFFLRPGNRAARIGDGKRERGGEIGHTRRLDREAEGQIVYAAWQHHPNVIVWDRADADLRIGHGLTVEADGRPGLGRHAYHRGRVVVRLSAPSVLSPTVVGPLLLTACMASVGTRGR